MSSANYCNYNFIAPIVVTVTGSGAAQNVGESYTLTCTVSGGGTTTTSYQWLRNGSPLTGQTSDTLSFTPLRSTAPSSNGDYVCQATIGGIMFSSNTFTIVVTCKSYALCKYYFRIYISLSTQYHH